MTPELTKAAQQALEVLESLQGGCTDHDDGTVEAITVWCPEVIEALRNALTQRPAAQTEREAFERAALAKWGQLDFERSEAVPEMYYNQRLDDAWIGFGFAVAWLRASLPAPQQATPAQDVGASADYCGDLAQQKADADARRGVSMPVSYYTSSIVGALLATQQAAPEPVGEVYGWAVTGLSFIWRGEHAQACAEQEAKTCGGTSIAFPLFTRPAPGVPEVDDLAQFIRQIDGKHSMGAGALAEHICDWLAAAQAKGAGHA